MNSIVIISTFTQISLEYYFSLSSDKSDLFFLKSNLLESKSLPPSDLSIISLLSLLFKQTGLKSQSYLLDFPRPRSFLSRFHLQRFLLLRISFCAGRYHPTQWVYSNYGGKNNCCVEIYIVLKEGDVSFNYLTFK